MNAEQYFKMVDTLDILSIQMTNDLATNRRGMDVEDLLYGLFEIIPVARFFNNNPYYKAFDKEAYNEECVEHIRHYTNKPYQRYVGRQRMDQLSTISNGLCNGLFIFGQTKLFVPNSMVGKFEANRKKYKDGKEILVEIFDYWKKEIEANEWHEEYEVYRLAEETVAVKTTKPIEQPVKTPPKQPYTSSIASVYGDSESSDPIAEREYAYYKKYGPDVDDFDDYSSNDDSRFDEDGSNWSYNEEHDD